jgi:tRNA threonylcarbamoyladenosine biosynthesis protein TsaE
LGAGKTVFVRGLARALGYPGRVTSPTFTIVNDYKDPAGQTLLLHFDLYRLNSASDLFDIGWYDYLDTGAICAVEWAEKVSEALPPNAFRVFISGSGDMERTIKTEGEDL